MTFPLLHSVTKLSLSVIRAIERSSAGKACWSGAGSERHGLVTAGVKTRADGLVPTSGKGGLGTRVPRFSK